MTVNVIIGNGWSFPPQFTSPSSGPFMVTGDDEIRQSIWILISTLLGERVMHPQFGSGLSTFTFEDGNLSTLSDLKEDLYNTILLGESRVDLDEIFVDIQDRNSGRLSIDITYTVRETNTRSNLVFPFYIHEFT